MVQYLALGGFSAGEILAWCEREVKEMAGGVDLRLAGGFVI